MFRQISKIALDGVSADLQMRLKRAVEGSADEALTLRSTAWCKVGDQPGSGEAGRPVAYAHREGESRAQTEKKSEAVAPAVAVFGHRFLPTIGRELATARRAEPHGSAVVISLAMYRAQRHAALRSMMD